MQKPRAVLLTSLEAKDKRLGAKSLPHAKGRDRATIYREKSARKSGASKNRSAGMPYCVKVPYTAMDDCFITLPYKGACNVIVGYFAAKARPTT